MDLFCVILAKASVCLWPASYCIGNCDPLKYSCFHVSCCEWSSAAAVTYPTSRWRRLDCNLFLQPWVRRPAFWSAHWFKRLQDAGHHSLFVLFIYLNSSLHVKAVVLTNTVTHDVLKAAMKIVRQNMQWPHMYLEQVSLFPHNVSSFVSASKQCWAS